MTLVAAAGLLLAGAHDRGAWAGDVPDPGVPGPHPVVTGEYTLPSLPVDGLDEPVEVKALVAAPELAPGRLPVVLFLHGQYPTCSSGPAKDDSTFALPCDEGYEPTLSYRGFLPYQRLLASQGFLTVSIAADALNAQDGYAPEGGAPGRSALIRHHLTHLARWAAGGDGEPDILRRVPAPDLSRVVLAGHSRGGDGVNRALLDSLSAGVRDWRIRGLILLGTTSFGHNPVAGVPSMSILPGCDGDAVRLEGQVYVDGTRGVGDGRALHSAVYLAGANHNWFNTEWTPGQTHGSAWDDFSSAEPDPVCTPGTAPGRLTAREQQAAGATYIAAAARLFGRGDAAVRPLIDGSGATVPSAGRAMVRTHAIGGGRTPLLVPDPAVTADGARICRLADADPATSCGLPDGSPHGAAVARMTTEPGRYGAALRWTGSHGTARLRPPAPVSLAGAEAVAMRVVVPANSTGTRLSVAVTDTRGRRAELGEARLDGLPGSATTYAAWAQEVRLPLGAAARLAAVAELEITARGSAGQAWLLDAWGWRPALPEPRADAPTRVDLHTAVVEEGDDGKRPLTVPVTVTGTAEGTVWLGVVDLDDARQFSAQARVRPGDQRIELPVTVTGNRRFQHDHRYVVQAWPARGTVVGSYRASVVLHDDDPLPAVTITPPAARVTEGGELRWTLTLSEPIEEELTLTVSRGERGDDELSTLDVDPDWLAAERVTPQPERSLAAAWLHSMTIRPGEVTASVTVPTIADDVAEPAEHLRLRLSAALSDGSDPIVGELTGTVTDG